MSEAGRCFEAEHSAYSVTRSRGSLSWELFGRETSKSEKRGRQTIMPWEHALKARPNDQDIRSTHKPDSGNDTNPLSSIHLSIPLSYHA